MSYVSMAGLATALDQLMAVGQGRLEAHSRDLSRRLIQGAGAHGWTPFRAPEDASASPHIVSLAHPGSGVGGAIGALRRNHIVCGVRNGRIRVSLAPYNDSADVDALVDSMAVL